MYTLQFDQWAGPDPDSAPGSAIATWTDGVHKSYSFLDGPYTWDWQHETAGSTDGFTATLSSPGGEQGMGGFARNTLRQFLGVFDAYGGFTTAARAKVNVVQGTALAGVIHFTSYATGVGAYMIVDSAGKVGIAGEEKQIQRVEVPTIAVMGAWHCYTMAGKRIIGGPGGEQLVVDIWVDGQLQWADRLAADGTSHFLVVNSSGDPEYPWYPESDLYANPKDDDITCWQPKWTSADAFDCTWDYLSGAPGILPGWDGVVPEPSGLLALASGLLGLTGCAIRRKR
jgi:hypothetical protein